MHHACFSPGGHVIVLPDIFTCTGQKNMVKRHDFSIAGMFCMLIVPAFLAGCGDDAPEASGSSTAADSARNDAPLSANAHASNHSDSGTTFVMERSPFPADTNAWPEFDGFFQQLLRVRDIAVRNEGVVEQEVVDALLLQGARLAADSSARRGESMKARQKLLQRLDVYAGDPLPTQPKLQRLKRLLGVADAAAEVARTEQPPLVMAQPKLDYITGQLQFFIGNPESWPARNE